MITTPLYTAQVNGKPLRYFLSPLSPEPELPWHSYDDLQACLDMPRSLRREFLHKLKHQWKADVRTVGTLEGITTICPHFMAQGMIEAMIEVGQTTRAVYAEYTRGGAEAMAAATKGMSQEDGFEWSMAAARKTLAVE